MTSDKMSSRMVNVSENIQIMHWSLWPVTIDSASFLEKIRGCLLAVKNHDGGSEDTEVENIACNETQLNRRKMLQLETVEIDIP